MEPLSSHCAELSAAPGCDNSGLRSTSAVRRRVSILRRWAWVAMTRAMIRRALPLCFVLTLAGCQKEEFGPVSSPAAEHPSYAADYPEKLERTHKRFEIERSWAKDFDSEFKKFPEELEEPDWETVARVYMLAEEDGRSAHYAEVRRQNAEVAQFFVDEKKELVRKVSGGVHYQAEQERCDAKFYGTIDRGLENGVKERFEEREDDGSQAAQFIKLHESEIGKKNAETLRKQAKALSAAAQLVYVDLAERHQELSSMVEESEQVKKTIDRRLQELGAATGEDPKTDEDKARAEERERLTEAKSSLESAVSAAKKSVETSQEDVENARKSFEEALSKLRADVKKRMDSK